MSLTAGGTVGRYQIQQLLGTGGMGEVYKAVDPLLGRPVALKVLRPELSRDPERLTRFLQEARAASALNHPNILTIHEVGDHDQSRYLVSEFVDGETLRQRVARSPLTLREILDVTIQAASALSAAHAAGIVHRDIKPDNLMLRPDGYAKVLDFGVATFARTTAARDSAATIDGTMATIAQPDTGAGMIVGTIAYMSPEQARGLPVDGRADCYSLGVVLYELVTGRAPFAAPTTTDLLVAILERDPPPVRTIAKGLPLQLEWIIEKALEKDPNLRYQTIADLRVDLQRLKSALESGRLVSAVADAAPAADAVVERELTDDSPDVVAAGRTSWITVAWAAVAAIVVGVAMSYYHLARPGAELPLQLPEGGVVTKARDTIEEFGYRDIGSRVDTEFSNVLSMSAIVRSAGLPAARQAIREGGPVAQWRAGITRNVNPSTGNLDPRPGDFSVRLDPRGRLMAFATGYGDSAVAHADRARATTIAVEAIKKSFDVDASGYELEVVERSFPPGKTELTFRSKDLVYGHNQQFRVNLQGEQLILIDRSYQRPRGYTAPDTPLGIRIYTGAGAFLLVAVFVVGWGFGLYYLFKTRNWDALTRRMPIAICVLVIVQVGLQVIGNSGIFESLIGVAAITVMLIGIALPALAGVLLWIGHRSPARLWAAEQLTRGRWKVPAVSASLIDGVTVGAVMVAIGLLGDWAALQVPGFEPSISRELDAVDAGFGSMIGDTLSAAAFLVLGGAFAVEALERFRLHPIVATAIIAVGAGLFAANDQREIVPSLPLVLAYAAGAVLITTLYRRRGFLAAWIAGMAFGYLTNAMAL
ncbi:MAG TPA: serine/threonine-protein kinase, partial [Vicinamibacterales bacterium]|nr:serine/threonine-protein kinase [Vicinamibacterales bacterium]